MFSIILLLEQNIDHDGDADVIVHISAEYQGRMIQEGLQMGQGDGHFPPKNLLKAEASSQPSEQNLEQYLFSFLVAR